MILGVIFLIACIYKYQTGKPSYKCPHEWEEIHRSRSEYFDYYIHKCNKCGKMKKTSI